MKVGDKIKLKFGGGIIGVITAEIKEFQVSYPIEGKPASGRFTRTELEKTDEDPEPLQMGFRVGSMKDD